MVSYSVLLLGKACYTSVCTIVHALTCQICIVLNKEKMYLIFHGTTWNRRYGRWCSTQIKSASHLKLRYVYDQSETRHDRLNIHNETQVSVRLSDSHRKVSLNINWNRMYEFQKFPSNCYPYNWCKQTRFTTD